jgi:hypothetical protein
MAIVVFNPSTGQIVQVIKMSGDNVLLDAILDVPPDHEVLKRIGGWVVRDGELQKKGNAVFLSEKPQWTIGDTVRVSCDPIVAVAPVVHAGTQPVVCSYDAEAGDVQFIADYTGTYFVSLPDNSQYVAEPYMLIVGDNNG